MVPGELGRDLLRNGRYVVVETLAETREPMHLDELAERMEAVSPADATSDPWHRERPDELAVRLHHVDVPVLAGHDVVEYWPTARFVRPGPAFDEARGARRNLHHAHADRPSDATPSTGE